MNTSKSESRRLPLLGLLALLTSSPARAGDIDRHCFGSAGVETLQLWPSAANLPWDLCTGPYAEFVVPAFPPISCSTALNPDVFTHPGVQSIWRGMQAWTQAAARPGPLGQTAAPVSFTTSHDNVPLPSVGGAVPVQVRLMLNDGRNRITFWEPTATFLPFGGLAVLGLAMVTLNISTGAITECDIGMQSAPDPARGQPFWSWIEHNDLYGYTLASNNVPLAGPTAETRPTFGYADIQGVFTHEIGHMLGLGHTTIDSTYVGSANLSRKPTMFDEVDGFPFNEEVSSHIGLNTLCRLVHHPSKGPATLLGGILGSDQGTLEYDDVRAIRAGYPDLELAQGLGTIQGTVASQLTNPLRGANVVAVKTTDPSVRASTFVYNDGMYRLSMLDPGEYYVYVEPVDQNPITVLPPGYYFPNVNVANYIWQYLLPNLPLCTAYEEFTTEFHNGPGETLVESTPMAVTPIRIDPTDVVTANFEVANSGHALAVEVLFPGQLPARNSGRGDRAAPFQTTYPIVDILVTGTPGRRVVLNLDSKFTPGLIGNQLVLVQGGSDPSLPVVPVGTIGANGQFRFQLQLNAAMGMRNIFAQAAVGVGANLRLTNVANVLVGTN